MNILSISYPFSQVSENTSGGAEQILRMLDHYYSQQKCNSFVIAPEGSVVKGQLIASPFHKHEVLTEELKSEVYTCYKQIINEAIENYKPDIIHFHGLDFHMYMPETSIPMVVTLHLPYSYYPEGVLERNKDKVHYNCVSVNQHQTFSDTIKASIITNGIIINELEYNTNKKDYALCLGRVCWEKGYHHAIGVSKRTGIPLIIAGNVFPYPFHLQYFEEQIRPNLNEKIKFIEPADINEKKRLLAEAKCLLIPSQVPETSSLSAMEAMASGTPVIAFNIGALPEIIKNEVTGYIAYDETNMCELIKLIDIIDPYTCFKEASLRFNASAMADNYLKLYKDILNG